MQYILIKNLIPYSNISIMLHKKLRYFLTEEYQFFFLSPYNIAIRSIKNKKNEECILSSFTPSLDILPSFV
jgi:hypothetical protein